MEWFDVSIEGAIIGRGTIDDTTFDSADYRFGFPFSYRYGRYSAKFHIWHLTSHLADERIDEGRDRLSYHKEELAIAFAYDWTPDVRTYVDLGLGVYIGTPNKRWRAQCGAEWILRDLWSGAPTMYTAVDIKWRQETDWDTAVAAQVGIWLLANSDPIHRLRLYLEYYFGHSAQTQFPEEREHYAAIGIGFGF